MKARTGGSSILSLVFKDINGKELFYGSLSAIPRRGEIVYVDGIKYWVERIEWKIRRNTVYKDQFAFEGVNIIIDTAAKV